MPRSGLVYLPILLLVSTQLPHSATNTHTRTLSHKHLPSHHSGSSHRWHILHGKSKLRQKNLKIQFILIQTTHVLGNCEWCNDLFACIGCHDSLLVWPLILLIWQVDSGLDHIKVQTFGMRDNRHVLTTEKTPALHVYSMGATGSGRIWQLCSGNVTAPSGAHTDNWGDTPLCGNRGLIIFYVKHWPVSAFLNHLKNRLMKRLMKALIFLDGKRTCHRLTQDCRYWLSLVPRHFESYLVCH